MRVTLAIPAFLPARDYGGPVEKVLRLVAPLRDLGVVLTVVTSTARAPGVADLPPGPDVVEGIHVLRLPTPWLHRWAPWVHWDHVDLGDVVHVLGAWNGLSYTAIGAARRAGVPWVWEPAGMLVVAGRHRGLKMLARPWHRHLVAAATRVVVTSHREAQEAGITTAATVRLRANPVPPAPPASADRRTLRARFGWGDEPVWGYLGRIARRKGIETMLHAWRQAPHGRLIFAGPVEEPTLAAAIDATSGCVRLAALDGAARWDYLRALDALVLVPPYGENFGNVAAEAVAAGTPVLLSSAVGAGEWLAGDPGVRVISTKELKQAFAAGPPPPPQELPPQLAPTAVAMAQVAIWREAISTQSASMAV